MKRTLRPFDQLPRGPQRTQHVRPLTETEAARHMGYFERGCANPVRAFQQCARRLGIPVKYSGRFRMYDPRVLEAFMEREGWTRRHRVAKAS